MKLEGIWQLRLLPVQNILEIKLMKNNLKNIDLPSGSSNECFLYSENQIFSDCLSLTKVRNKIKNKQEVKEK